MIHLPDPRFRWRETVRGVATIWFLTFVSLGGALVCCSYMGRDDGSAKGHEVAEPARPVSVNFGPTAPHTKHIEDVKAGDRVWAYDTATGMWAPKMVIKPLVHDYDGDPDSEIPDQPGAGSNIKGSHTAKGGTLHGTGEHNVNPKRRAFKGGEGAWR